MLAKLLVAILLCLVAHAAGADSWGAPKVSGHASPQGRWVARVLPGTDRGGTFGFAGAERGDPATAVLYRLTSAGTYTKHKDFKLLNPVAPVFVAISDAGRLITLDNWHNMGIGPSVVVVYSPDGAVVRSLGLMDIYSPAELKQFSLSTSSVWWRCNVTPEFDPRTSSIELMDVLGSNVEISLETGSVKRGPTTQRAC